MAGYEKALGTPFPLRKRIERKVRKCVRCLQHRDPRFVVTLENYEKPGASIFEALRKIVVDSALPWVDRGTAMGVLALAHPQGAADCLLDLFFSQTDPRELWETALAIECGAGAESVSRLAGALYDKNLHRRQAAARALGWIAPPTRRAAKALISALLDKSQPSEVRGEAAESLAYSDSARGIAPLISVLNEPDVSLRFWAIFALGGIGQWQIRKRGCADARVIEALENVLPNNELPPGNWWSIGRECLAMLAPLDERYRRILESEVKLILLDSNASTPDRRWAEFYGRSLQGNATNA